MGGSKSKMVIMFILSLIILEGGWSEGYLDHERFALLLLKLFFNDPSNYLYDWVDDEGATDCCQWEGVECSNTTGRVIVLQLSKRYSGEYWYLNASLFTPFQQLESLVLSDNNIAGCVENEGLERLSKLSNLNMLGLSGNLFNNTILSSLAHLSSLTSLYLSYNRLEGSIDVKGPRGLERLSRLSNLKMLDLRGNLFNNSILSSLAHLSSLRSLYLNDNRLAGSIDVKEFDSLINLEELDTSDNEIDNFVVPEGYRGLRKLKSLYLSRVGIRDGGKLLQSMGSFPSLNTLDLMFNNLTEQVTTTQELHNFTNLAYLTLDDSSLHISLLQSIASIFPSLKNLSISGCEVNGVLGGQGFLHFKSLEQLEMDDARIAVNTSFLQIIGESMPSLKYLSLSNSSLSTDSRTLDQG